MKQKNKNRIGRISTVLFMIIFALGCSPDPDEYARPDGLTGTIYLKLQSMGTFSYYLKCIDQSTYKEALTKGGSWTVFAPTDAAFEKFMKDEGYSNFEAIPAERILYILQNSIIVNGWNTTTLTYYPSQFYEGAAFRRTTQYKDPIVEVDSKDYPNLINFPLLVPGKYLVDTSNGRYKTTNYFLDSYIDRNGFKTTDYDFMFPGMTFTKGDMKVFDANVSQTNVVAENGMIYALDKVLEPQKNLYQNLTSPEYGGKYTLFKSLLERFATLKLRGNEVNPVTGVTEAIYTFSYLTGISNNYLPYNPDDENYPALKNNVNRTWANAPGMLVPTNEALLNYLKGNSILGQFYTSYDKMPLDVLGKFLSSYFTIDFWNICPSSYGQTFNVALSAIDYKAEDVVDKKFCSNGFFVGVNTIYNNNSFSTILGPLLLDSNYSIMLKAVKELGIDNGLLSKSSRFTIFGVKNDQFVDVADPNSAYRKITVLNWEPDLSKIYMKVTGDPVAANNRTYPDPSATSSSASDIAYVMTTLKAIVLNQIVEKDVDFSTRNYYQTKSGEFLYVSGANSVQGGGDIQTNRSVSVKSTRETDNGKFYEMSSVIERPLRFTYAELLANSSSFSSFLEVLKGADAITDIPSFSSDKLVGFLNLSKSFTLLAPNNAAVAQAISDGVIPNPSTANLASMSALNLAIAKRDLLNFAKKHFIQTAIPTDGKTTGTFPSLYYGKILDFAPVYDQFIIGNSFSPSSLTLKNVATGATVKTTSKTNLLSKRVVIHEIDSYIK